MTKDEREALLKLWEEVPGTRPAGLSLHSSEGWVSDAFGVPTDHAAAIARDAMVQYLLVFDGAVNMNRLGRPKYTPLTYSANVPRGPSGEYGSLLLALIAACRRVGGKEA